MVPAEWAGQNLRLSMLGFEVDSHMKSPKNSIISGIFLVTERYEAKCSSPWIRNA